MKIYSVKSAEPIALRDQSCQTRILVFCTLSKTEFAALATAHFPSKREIHIFRLTEKFIHIQR